MSLIFRLFRRSPFKPLQGHMDKSCSCAMQLLPLFEALFEDDWERVASLVDEIVAMEEAADDLKREIRQMMPKDLFLPVNRTDLIETMRLQDGFANRARDIARLLLARHMNIPQGLRHPYLDFLKRCLKAADQAKTAVNELDELIEIGFEGERVERVESMLKTLDEIETDADWLQLELRDMLFAIEKELYAVDVIFIYQLIEWTGEIADRAQQVGYRLQLMLAR